MGKCRSTKNNCHRNITKCFAHLKRFSLTSESDSELEPCLKHFLISHTSLMEQTGFMKTTCLRWLPLLYVSNYCYFKIIYWIEEKIKSLRYSETHNVFWPWKNDFCIARNFKIADFTMHLIRSFLSIFDINSEHSVGIRLFFKPCLILHSDHNLTYNVTVYCKNCVEPNKILQILQTENQ